MSLVEQANTVRQRIAARLQELEPLVREYNELRQLAGEMGVDDHDLPAVEEPASEPSSPVDPVPEPGPGSTATPAPRRATRPRRAAGAGRRAAASQQHDDDEDVGARVLAAVTDDPGKTVAEYAQVLDISPTALYRPVRELTNEGALVKRARALFPA